MKSLIINTNLGKIKGFIADKINVFKGIPYAEAPIKSLRFKPPIEKKPWKNVFKARKFGVSSFQGPVLTENLFGPLTKQSENNCLTLNIWTPTTNDENLPVMFWIHGGGFIYSGSSRPIYDGHYLSKRGNVVVVTINYRLGIFGFLYIPDVMANLGMLDQILALKWVKENISHFGGDPNNITIFGESAGAYSVMTLMSMPLAKGLFQKAIAQSPYAFEIEPPLRVAKRILEKLNCTIDTVKNLKKIPAKKLNKAQNQYLIEVMNTSESYYSNFRPCIDNKTIPTHPLNAIRNGSSNNVNLLLGTNENEAAYFTYLNPEFSNLNEEKLKLKLLIDLKRFNLEHKINDFIEYYKKPQNERKKLTPIEIYNKIYTNLYYNIPTIRYAEAQLKNNPNVFHYLFTWRSPMYKAACHSIDLPFIFGYLDKPNMKEFIGAKNKVKNISDRMIDAWVNFAKSSSPNHENIPEWHKYSLKERNSMIIDEKFKIENLYNEEEMNLWKDFFR